MIPKTPCPEVPHDQKLHPPNQSWRSRCPRGIPSKFMRRGYESLTCGFAWQPLPITDGLPVSQYLQCCLNERGPPSAASFSTGFFQHSSGERPTGTSQPSLSDRRRFVAIRSAAEISWIFSFYLPMTRVRFFFCAPAPSGCVLTLAISMFRHSTPASVRFISRNATNT